MRPILTLVRPQHPPQTDLASKHYTVYTGRSVDYGSAQERAGQTLTLMRSWPQGPSSTSSQSAGVGKAVAPWRGSATAGGWGDACPLESGCPRIQIPAVIHGQNPP